jgi:hypothetical protein
VQPKVLYEFADPALEALPSGQKILLRMGPENAARVKAKLREIRALVAKEGGAAKAAGRRRRSTSGRSRVGGARSCRCCHQAADGHRWALRAPARGARSSVSLRRRPRPASGDRLRACRHGDAPFRRAYRAFQSDADRKPVSANRSRVGKVGSSGAVSVTRPDLMSCRRTTNPIATTTAAKIRKSSIVGISALSSRNPDEHPRRM